MISLEEKVDFLKKIDLCDGLSEKEIKDVSNRAVIKKFPKKNTIFLESEEGNMFYIIYSGNVKISKIDEDGNEVIFTVLDRGDFFGEMSIIDGSERSANAISIEEVELLTLDKADFKDILKNYNIFSYNLLKIFAERIRATDALIKGLFLDTAEKRVMHTIHTLSKKVGQLADDEMTIPDFLNQTDLASLSGTSRETLSRTMKKFEKLGIIKKQNKNIIIPNYRKFENTFITV